MALTAYRYGLSVYMEEDGAYGLKPTEYGECYLTRELAEKHGYQDALVQIYDGVVYDTPIWSKDHYFTAMNSIGFKGDREAMYEMIYSYTQPTEEAIDDDPEYNRLFKPYNPSMHNSIVTLLICLIGNITWSVDDECRVIGWERTISPIQIKAATDY